MTLDQLMEHGKEAARHLFEKQGTVHPMWICEMANGEIFPICVEMPDRSKRTSFAEELKATFKRHSVVRYVAILEAWVVEGRGFDDLKRFDLGKSLQEHPDRREAVFITAEDIDGSERCGQFYILRPEYSKPKLSEFKELGDANPSKGRFTHLLNTEN